MKKRISALMLALMVMVSAWPAMAFAEDEAVDDGSPITIGEEAAELAVSNLKVKEKTSKYVILTWKLKQGEEVYAENVKDDLTVYAKTDGKKYKAQDVTIKFDSSAGEYTAKITGLDAATEYTFKVKETANKSYAEKTVKTASVVGNVKTFEALSTYNGVILKWKSVKNATGYTIKWKSGKKSGKIKISKGKTVKYLHKLPESLRTKKIKYTIVADRKGYGSSAKKAEATGEAIRTMHISFYLNSTRSLTSHDKAKKTTVFQKGTKLDAQGYEGGRYVFKYKGHTYYVKRWSASGQKYSQLDTDKTYTKEEAESYVNRRGLKSATDTLIWVNTYTQKLYLFKGSKGKWKLHKGPWDVCTGKSTTPTSTGLTRVRSKTRGCHDPFPQTPWWCVCAEFSIHGKAPYYPPMGQPASNGCVRNWSKNAYWMYCNVPINTAVFIY